MIKVNHVRMRMNPVTEKPEFMKPLGVMVDMDKVIGISDVEGDKQKIIHIYYGGDEFLEVFDNPEAANSRHAELIALLG